MATKHDLLSNRRQKSLSGLDKARRHHRAVRAARHAAIRDTLLVMRQEIRERAQAEAKVRRARKPRESFSAVPDLFQGLH